MNDSERATLIQTLMKAPETVLQINYVDQYLKSSRFAFRVTCDDNNDYVVKGIPTSHCQRQSRRLYGRELFMEQLVARLGACLRAPIPSSRLAELNTETVIDGTWLRCLNPAICHALQWLNNVDELKSLSGFL